MSTAPNDLRPTPHGMRRCGSQRRLGLGLASLGVAVLGLAMSPSTGRADRRPPPPGPNPTATHKRARSSRCSIWAPTFLDRAGNQATWGTNAASGNNPGGGGASQDATPQMFRSWAELYGINSRADAQGSFTGDQRRTYGGVAGVGATVLPGLNSAYRWIRATPRSTCRCRCRAPILG